MKKKINLNYFYSQVFVKQLKRLGLKHVCISPGSRNTPLTMAFAAERGIKKHVIVDERSSAFFALGLAKSTSLPAAVLTTSGTAAAEIYPAIIEAYNSRIPLIVITADRPAELIGTGANQTINQHNLYANHIRLFYDAGEPKTNLLALKRLQKKASLIYLTANSIDRGPVHINFPFRKPLEPNSFNGVIEKETAKEFLSSDKSEYSLTVKQKAVKPSVINSILESKRPLILAGCSNYGKTFTDKLFALAGKINAPVVADGFSNLRETNSDNLIFTASNFLRTGKADKIFEPDLIIQFGGAPTMNSVLNYFARVKCLKISVNRHGDLRDPSRTTDKIIALEPEEFLSAVSSHIEDNRGYLHVDEDWIAGWQKAQKEILELISMVINSSFPFEGRIVREVIRAVPSNSRLFISNSMPARDLDSFSGIYKKGIEIFCNRGASGIDGIVSTALGIAAGSKKRVYLITGDLAFYHDMNGLLAAKKYGLKLTVILINNGGGGIFKLLPIAEEKKYFDEYFKTELDLDFKHTAKLYGAEYKSIKSWIGLTSAIKSSVKSESTEIFEIKTDAENSVSIRKEFWNNCKKLIENNF